MPAPRVPEETLRLRGSRHAGKRGTTSPTVPRLIERPPCPRHLDPEARREWKALADALEALGRLGRIDGYLLTVAAEAIAEVAEASRHIRDEGHLLLTAAGRRVVNPWLGVRDLAAQRLRRCLGDLGLRPVDRPATRSVPASADGSIVSLEDWKRKYGKA